MRHRYEKPICSLQERDDSGVVQKMRSSIMFDMVKEKWKMVYHVKKNFRLQYFCNPLMTTEAVCLIVGVGVGTACRNTRHKHTGTGAVPRVRKKLLVIPGKGGYFCIP
jgi:hypothetical protein